MSKTKGKIKEQPSQLHRPQKDSKTIDLLSIKPTPNLKKNPAKNTTLKTAREQDSPNDSSPVSKRSRRRKTSKTSDAMDTEANPSDSDCVIDDVKDIIRQYHPVCVALQETFLKSCHTTKIRRYGCVRKDTERPSVSGGVCVFTSLDVPSSALPLHTSLQAVAVRIHSTSLITVCCLYLPPNTIIHQHDLNNLVDQLPAPFIILGDFNGHSTLWGSAKTNPRGRQIEQDLYNSDHFPVILSHNYDTDGKTFPPTYSYRRADWALFTQLAVITDTMVKTESADTSVQEVTNILITAAELSIPKRSSHLFQHYKPWWNTECQTAYKNQRKLWGIFRRYPTTENLLAFKKAKANARRVRRQSQRQSWIRYVSSLTSSTSSKQLWKKVKAANGIHREFSFPVLQTSNSVFSSPEEIANILVYGSARASVLKRLETVHHSALRICSGAFRTSPVTSFYVVCHQPPLELRRRQLSAMSVPSHPLKPFALAIGLNRLYEALSFNIKPFSERAKAVLNDAHLNNINIQENNILAFPPWDIKIFNYHNPFLGYHKAGTADVIYQRLFSFHRSKYCKYIPVYTDGSKTAGHNADTPTVIEILVLLRKLERKGFHIIFSWVPGHVGILGNEQADTAARSMSDHMQRPVCYRDLKTSTQNYIHRVWQETWDQQILNKLHNIHPSTSHWAALPVRRHDVRLTRLRIGHTRFPHRHLLLGMEAQFLRSNKWIAFDSKPYPIFSNHYHWKNSGMDSLDGFIKWFGVGQGLNSTYGF
ncbi:putative RNA-directed DNA polymerase from transposon BS [Trichonephila clavipes]|nr:putative RNA-directed DNA polymerase from transposon BS [Trichonephila clavipes]